MKSNYIIIASTILILAVVVYCAFYLHQTNKEEALAQFQEHKLLTARTDAVKIEGSLDNLSQEIQAISSLASLQYRDLRGMQEVVNSFFNKIKTEYAKSVSVCDEEGAIIYSTDKLLVGRNYKASDFFIWTKKKENKGSVFISSLSQIRGNDQEPPPYFRILLATPLYQEVWKSSDSPARRDSDIPPTLPSGRWGEDKRYSKPNNGNPPKESRLVGTPLKAFGDKFVGVVIVSIDLQELLDNVLQSVNTNSKHINSWVMDKDGLLLFQSEHPEMTLRNIRKTDQTCSECHTSFEYTERILTAKQGIVDYQLKDFPKKLAAFAPVEYKNISWIVVVNSPYDEVTASVDRVLRVILLLLGVVVVALIVSSVTIYRNNLLKHKAKEELRRLSEKKILEEEKLRSEIFKQLNATKDKFFSIIAHDLKNPFITLLGFTDLLLTDYSELSDEEKKYYIEEMKKSAEISHNLLQNLLQWSRAQTGRIEFNPQKLELLQIVDKNILLLKAAAEKKQIKLLHEIPPEIYVNADEEMLNTVLRNLLTNAIKFSNKGGTTSVNAIAKDNFVEVSVVDSGIGMDQNTIENLFRLDVAHSTIGTDNETGTGLGLILCKEFVEKHGGKIWVESEVGKGSSFRFTLSISDKRELIF